MRRNILLFVLLSLSVQVYGQGYARMDPVKLEAMTDKIMAEITVRYKEFVRQNIVPAMQQGAGGTSRTPVVIPPIFDAGYQPDPNNPPQIQDMLEPVGRAVAYAALFCQGEGMPTSAEMDNLWVSFPAFSRVRAQIAKQLLNGVLGSNVPPQYDLSTDLTTTTVQCSKLLAKICKDGSCNSGKCGLSRALGGACVHFCAGPYNRGVNICRTDYYYRQVVPQIAVGAVSGTERGASSTAGGTSSGFGAGANNLYSNATSMYNSANARFNTAYSNAQQMYNNAHQNYGTFNANAQNAYMQGQQTNGALNTNAQMAHANTNQLYQAAPPLSPYGPNPYVAPLLPLR